MSYWNAQTKPRGMDGNKYAGFLFFHALQYNSVSKPQLLRLSTVKYQDHDSIFHIKKKLRVTKQKTT